MIAHNKVWLEYEWIHEQLDKAYHETCIDREELSSNKKIYAMGFYTPQVLIGIGLFLLSVIILIFSFGLLVMFFPIGGTTATYGIESIFFGVTTYCVLEWIVSKGHFRSGVDEALIWSSAIFMIAGINLCFEISPVHNTFLVFGLALWYTLRFLESLMAVLAFFAVLAFIIFNLQKAEQSVQALIPAAIIVFSILVFFLANSMRGLERYKYYRRCLLSTGIAALLSIYLAGNYYIVSTVATTYLHLDLLAEKSLPLGKIYWVLTVSIPWIYLLLGIIRRDIWSLRTALVTLAIMIFTIRHYYHLIPIYVVMIIGGILLIGISFALLRWLRRPKFGFNIHEDFSIRSRNMKQFESIMIGRFFGSQNQAPENTRSFGGGSGDGAGAGGSY